MMGKIFMQIKKNCLAGWLRHALLTIGILITSTLSAQQQSLWVGQTYRCDATSAVMGLTSDVSWSTNGGYLSLTGSGFYRDVTITKYFSGTATITCSWKYRLYSGDTWKTQSRSWTVKCYDNPVSISPTEMTLSPGESAFIGHRLQYTNDYSSSASITYSSSNSSIATVSSSGLVTAKSSGTAFVTLYSSVSANSPYCTVTVKNIAVESVTIPSSVSIMADENKQLSASIFPSNSTIKSVEWYSRNSAIATVTSDGILKGVNPGETAVYCIINGTVSSNDCRVSVSEPNFTLISTTPGKGSSGASLFVEPKASFSLKLYRGDNYNGIRMRRINGNSPIPGNISLQGNVISFIPTTHLEPNEEYEFYIPSNSLKNKWGTHYAQDVTINFRTGNMEKLTLSIQPNEPLVPVGTTTAITCSVPHAAIYYTTDNSIPNLGSPVYTSPITISSDMKIMAIAKCDGYIDSDVLTHEYKIADLEMSLYPEDGMNNVCKNVIPYAKFNQNVAPSSAFDEITMSCNGKEVDGIAVCQDTVVYFVPDNLLEIGRSYKLSIPADAVATMRGEGNDEAETSFSTGLYALSCSAGNAFGAVVMSDGSLWTWGDYYTGDGTADSHLTPTRIMDDVKAVDTGLFHGVALKNDGSAWTWGLNSAGELGDGTTTRRYSPIKVMDNVSHVSASDSRTMFVKSDKSLWACGSNYYGQIGDGTTTNRKTPVKVMSDVVVAATGYYQSAAVTSNGDVYTWGSNYRGALGGWPVAGSSDSGTKVPYKSYTDEFVEYVECGENHTAILTTSGELRCAGDNTSGQCGAYTNAFNGYPGMMSSSGGYYNRWVTHTSSPKWKQISAGGENTGALDFDGNLYVCGENENGMVGLIGGTYLLDCDYLYYKKLSNVSSFSIGDQMGIAIKNDGSVWAWGRNDEGQLGIGHTSTKEVTPVKIMDGFSTNAFETILMPASAIMEENQQIVIPAKIEPYNAEFDRIVWTISDSEIADVASNGIVTAKAAGQCLVTANVYNYGDELLAQASCSVTIREATGIDEVTVCNSFTIRQIDNTIYISGLDSGTLVCVYNVEGMTVSKVSAATEGTVAVNLPRSAVYIVKIGNEARKIIVR